MKNSFLETYDSNLLEVEKLKKLIPDVIQVHLMSADKFNDQIEKRFKLGEPIESLTKSFWIDQSNTAEAWLFISLHRSFELLEISSTLLFNKKLVASAPVIRAIFELTISNLVVSGRAQYVLDRVLDHFSMSNELPLSDSFESDFVQAIWGTRIPGIYKDKKHLHRDIGVGKWIKELTKKYAEAEGLQESYDMLSDLCHPNLAGNRFFYSVNSENSIDFVTRKYETNWQNEAESLLKKTLSWSCVGILNYHSQTTQLINRVRTLLNVSSLH